jgi:HK97 family phage major capsid protein
MDELEKQLAALFVQMDAVKAELTVEGISVQDKNAKAKELEAVCDKIDAKEEEIKSFKADEATLARANAYSKPQKRKTAEVGKLSDSNIEVGKDNIMDDPKLGFENLGDVALAVHRTAVGQGYDPRLAVIGNNNPELQAAGLRQGNGPEGGFLVPPQFSDAMLTDGTSQSLDLYKDTANFNLGQTESITLPAINETSRKDGSRWGGTQAFWAEEEAAMTESDPSFREITLRPKELHVFTKVSNKLLKNSPIALGQLLNMIASDEINFRKSDAVINGDGVGKLKGIMASNALVSVAKESGQTAATVVLENTTKMMARLTPRFKAGSKWYINKDVLGQLQLMKVGDTPVFMPAGGVSGLPFATLHGLPIIETEYNDVLGNLGDILLTNLKAYITAQNGPVKSDTSIHFNFDVNKTAFRWVTEADGQTWAENAITDFKGSGTTSPYVTLALRS